MKKFRNLVIGGIETKIFNLILFTGILIAAAFLAVSAYQYNELQKLVTESSGEQQTAIASYTNELMEQVIENSMSRDTKLEGAIAEEMFSSLGMRVDILEEYARKLLSDPETPPAEYAAPDPARNGEICAQLIVAEGTDITDPALAARIGTVANMSNLMVTLFGASAETNSLFIALPEGVFLVTDDRTASKFEADGAPTPYDPRTRPWYQQAVAKGGLIFTDVEVDAFTGDIGIVCAKPVYVDGKLAAVVGSDLFLTSMQQSVQASEENGGFVCIVNQNGHVVFSPKTEGTFRVLNSAEAPDLRQSRNADLATLVKDAMAGVTEVRKISLAEGGFYMAGVPMPTVGWALLSAFSEDMAATPAAMMQDSYRQIQKKATETYRNNLNQGRIMIQVLMGILTVLLLGSALILGKRIVRPLNRITKRIAELSEENLEFKMEDAYKTGDEIEVLAESFAMLSHKTVEYVQQVKTVTAEKERINSELMMAREIQGSVLPRIFPPFPNNPSFDLYASMTPAKQVGGDFYDFFLVDDDHLALVMADVSGKGVPAALFMMIAKILIKNRLQSGEPLGDVMANVNNQLMEGNEAGMFVTVWAAVLTLSTGEGVVVNAGHEHPVLRRKDGQYEIIKYRHSMAVAMMEGVRFREHTFTMEPGDSLFVYTDGVPEANNTNSELMGEKRMLDALNRDPDAEPGTVLHNVMDGIRNFTAGAEQFDDITMLCLRYNGIQEKA